MVPNQSSIQIDKFEVPEELKNVKRVNPRTDRFEVRLLVTFLGVYAPTERTSCPVYQPVRIALESWPSRRSSSFTMWSGGALTRRASRRGPTRFNNANVYDSIGLVVHDSEPLCAEQVWVGTWHAARRQIRPVDGQHRLRELRAAV